MQVRSVSDSAKKFVTRGTAARDDYKSGVAGAGEKWKSGTAAANDAYKAGMTDALNNDTFRKAVERTPASTYQDNAVKLGPERFVTGISNAQTAYEAGVRPMAEALSSLTLSPRGSRQSGNNIRRVQEVADVLRKKKRELQGVGA